MKDFPMQGSRELQTPEQRKRRPSWSISQAEFWRLYLALVVGILGALGWWWYS